MPYITFALPHLQAVKAWMQARKGQAQLNVLNFELELKCRNRYFLLYPQFVMEDKGQLQYVNEFWEQARGFAGWLPYARPLRWPLWQDKLQFKQALEEIGLRTPAYSSTGAGLAHDYVLKGLQGSFGKGIYGPFRVGGAMPSISTQTKAEVFAEQFVPGKSLKVWFWGHKAFYAQMHERPTVVGDGFSNVQTLLSNKLSAIGQDISTYPEMASVVQALAYQEVNLQTVLKQDQKVWLDFRYGRLFAPWAATEAEDDVLPQLSAEVQDQFIVLGRFVAQTLAPIYQAPVLYAVDAQLDEQGQVWYLEINSNPMLPPAGYALVLSTLFDSPPHAGE